MSGTSLTCSPGGTIEDLNIDSLSSDQEELDGEEDELDGVDGAKKRKAPLTDKGQLIPKANATSVIWQHFKVWSKLRSPGYCVANCNYCEMDIRLLKGNTSHLLRHMESNHRKIMNDNRSKSASSSIASKIDVASKQIGNASPSCCDDSDKSKGPIVKFVKAAPKFEKQVLKWLSGKYLPLSTVEDPAFRDVCYSLNFNHTPLGTFILYASSVSFKICTI